MHALIRNNTLANYLELCKPRVVALMLITVAVGMLLAKPGLLTWQVFVFGMLGIALTASAGAVINHLADRHIDAVMARTHRRPIPAGHIEPWKAWTFATILGATGLIILLSFVNLLTAILTLSALIIYAFIYTLYLKRATPQNIVIGGLAGAMPPLLGWIAVTGRVDASALLLALIVYAWTPPHFWALSIYRYNDYAKAKIPMLPVTHGIPLTKLFILLYVFLLSAITFLPFVIAMNGWIYLCGASLLNARFIYWAWRLKNNDDPSIGLKTFRYSIIYLFALFMIMLLDHYIILT